MSAEQDLLAANNRLLQAIDSGNWTAYRELCDADITCFEPEARGNLVAGLPFHKFYFELPSSGTPKQSTISSPSVRVIGELGLVCYIRVVQKLDPIGAPISATAEETRVWKLTSGQWKHIHFHRSPC